MLNKLSKDDLLKLSTVLFEIGQAAFYAKDGDLVSYPTVDDIKKQPSADSLTFSQLRFYVFLIQDEGAIKVINEYTYGKRETPYRWLLKVDKHGLKELTARVEELYLSGAVDLMAGAQGEEGTKPSHAYVLTIDDLIESLQRQYEGFIKLPEKGFFLGIADYVKFIDENPGFEKILQVINEFKLGDTKQLMELEAKIEYDVEKAEKIIMDRINNSKIPSVDVKMRIDDHKSAKEGRIHSGESRAQLLHDSLSHIVMALHENGYTALVNEFIKLIPDSKSISGYSISEHYYPYEKALHEYKSSYQSTIWGSWSELIAVYMVIHKYQEHMQSLRYKKDVSGEVHYQLMHGEMEEVLEISKHDGIRLQFIKADYLTHINRVHNFIINKLKSEPDRNVQDTGKLQNIRETEITRYQAEVNVRGNIRQLVKDVIKVRNVRGKEKKFLQALSKMKPVSIQDLSVLTGTKNCKTLKFAVAKKLEGQPWSIKTIKGSGWYKSYYQLKYLTE